MTETGATATQVEAPSGKGAGDENFPVGSRLIHPALRPHVAAFYAFARAADDVADSAELAPEEKLRRLDLFEAGLDRRDGAPSALRLRASLDACGVSDAHARDLLKAFRQDAVQLRYRDWEGLAGYCALSAHPVGRFLLDLHGESRATWGPGDALCAALQVLNHLQDLKADRARLDRVYLPLDWMEAEGVDVTALGATRASPGLRRVIDRTLDACDALIEAARPLPGMIASPRLAGETAAILALARRLAARLRRADPIAGRVALSRADFARAAGRGALLALGASLRRGRSDPRKAAA